MKHFTITELCASETAKKNGIYNEPTAAVADNLVRLVENVLDPLRIAYGKPITVNSGYRSKALNRLVGGVSTSQHCFDDKTEILTSSGWRTYNTINKDDLVFSYNINEAKIELVPIDTIIIRKHDGRMMSVLSKCNDFMVTDKHRIMVRYDCHKYKRHGVRNITEEGQKYFDSLKTENDKYHIELAEDVFGKRRIYKNSGLFKDGTRTDNINLLKFCMAFVADGYWCKKDGTKPAIGFRFKKTRKVEQLQTLLRLLNWEYTCRLDKHGVYNFYIRSMYANYVFDIVGFEKKIPKSLLLLHWEDMKTITDYYCSYDGCIDKRDGKGRMTIASVVKNNADILQAMFILSGRRCKMSKQEERTYNIKGQLGFAKEVYILTVCDKNESKVKEGSYSWVDYSGVVWCVNNRNTTLITRRNGCVCIQGNCEGKAADIVGTPNTKEENGKLFELIRKLNLPFCQLINESDLTWVHVSYDRNNIKRQVLKL